ncbi:MAG: hypothetical protein IJY16_03150 [Clostridia bacterium]|nr:hypothetical protein [Clostridia bacterium]
MKRSVLLLLLLSLLLAGCKQGLPVFTVDADGNGYTNKETGVHYAALDFHYEAVKRGTAVGAYTNKKLDYTRSFYSIPGVDASLFLTDDDLTVWYAGDAVIDAATWELSGVLICQEEAISVELFGLLPGEEDAAIAEIQTLWFSGEATELPEGTAMLCRTVKLSTKAWPGLYYSFYFYLYESGEAYFYAPVPSRAVAVPEALVEKFLPDEEAEA